MERRRDQFTKEPGYYIVPMPYSLPGIGEGFLVGAYFNNIYDTHSDVIGFVLGGAIRDNDGHLIQEASTDDYLDPRRGVRYQLSRWWKRTPPPY